MHISVDALLFDLDGTLTDSTSSVDRSWRKLADRLGIDFESLEGSYHGVPARQTLSRLMDGSTPEEIDEVNSWLAVVEISDTEGVVPIAGARELLAGLPGHRWAIVTSGTRSLAESRIAASNLPTPAVTVTADDVRIGKPDPAPYLLAARRLGFEPRRTLVLEDAPAGVAAGLASGATVLGLRTTHGDLGVPSIRDFTELEVVVEESGLRVRVHGQ